MPKSATIEQTDNGGFIVRTHTEFDGKGNMTEKGKVVVATSMKEVSRSLDKIFSEKSARIPDRG
jgi:hypothetical protein